MEGDGVVQGVGPAATQCASTVGRPPTSSAPAMSRPRTWRKKRRTWSSPCQEHTSCRRWGGELPAAPPSKRVPTHSTEASHHERGFWGDGRAAARRLEAGMLTPASAPEVRGAPSSTIPLPPFFPHPDISTKLRFQLEACETTLAVSPRHTSSSGVRHVAGMIVLFSEGWPGSYTVPYTLAPLSLEAKAPPPLSLCTPRL